MSRPGLAAEPRALPRSGPLALEQVKRVLGAELGPSKMITEAAACEPYGSDDCDVFVAPDIVVLAETAEDIATVLRAAQACQVPVTPRLGGTGRTGGAVPLAGGIVLVAMKMNRIDIDRDERIAVVGPGVITHDLHTAAASEGLFYPPDPNSLKTCTLGGNVAENAGGPRAFKYGVTRDYVLGLGATLMGGTALRTGKRTLKGVTGYDVTALLTGSEGTLAVFHEIVVRLVPMPEGVGTLLALFDDVQAAARAVAEIVRGGLSPRCIELLDRSTLQAVRTRGVALDEGAGALLLLEVDGDTHVCERDVERIGNACALAGARSVLVAQDGTQRDKLWEARREMSPAIRALARHKLSEDVVVPRRHIAALLAQTEQVSERTGVRSLAYGHAGDGNLHVNFLWNDDSEFPAVEASIESLFRHVIALGGTLSGEHGIGISKAPYLALEQSEELIALQLRLKAAFDPQGLLNPGKIFPRSSHGAC